MSRLVCRRRRCCGWWPGFTVGFEGLFRILSTAFSFLLLLAKCRCSVQPQDSSVISRAGQANAHATANPVNGNRRSSRILMVRQKGTKESKSRCQHLNSLKKFVLSRHVLETNFVVLQESFELFELEFCVPLSGEDRSYQTLVFQVIHRKPSERKEPHPSHPVGRCTICGCV